MLDYVLRDILTRVGGVDACVSEFIRVTDQLLPARVFTRIMPELHTGGRTLAGTPVFGQLLGSDPECLAENAAQLAALGPAGIDLNFGCPAKVVNRHGGGAMLLNDPELIHRIVRAVRRAVPAHVPVTGKMRLGFDDDSRAEDCARAIADGGASHIVVHARTRRDGYRPPAYWARIADLRAVVNIPMIANGEIWNLADALRCREVSGGVDLMLGRGMVTDPGLAWALRRHDAQTDWASEGMPDGGPSAGCELGLPPPVAWADIQPLLPVFWLLVAKRVVSRHRAGRLKQWLNLMRRRYPQAQSIYEDLRVHNEPAHVEAYLRNLDQALIAARVG